MIRKLLEKLRRGLVNRVPLAISLSVTVFALTVYSYTFFETRPTTLFEQVSRLEMATLDARFEYRGPRTPDPRIVIVDIDQKSQEVLGRWPFHRGHFARMLDNLRADGAKVVAFDVTFSQPDSTIKPIETLQARLGAQPGAQAPGVVRELARIKEEFDYDAQFTAAIQRFPYVVLGNFFLYTDADLRGLDQETLERFAQLASYHPFPQVRPTETAGVEGYRRVVQLYGDRGVLPRGAEANLDQFASSLPPERLAAGFFNVFPDPDGVVRRATLALPYGTAEDLADWDMFAALDVQALRFFLGVPYERVVLQYGPQGVDSFQLGNFYVHPDPLGRVLVNYHGVAGTYPYHSIADVVQGKFERGTFQDKLVLVGASATGIADLRATPFSPAGYPGVEIHANVIDNALHNDFLQKGGAQATLDIVAILLFGVPLGLLLHMLPPRWMWVGLLVVFPFLGGVQLAFNQGWWLNVVTPAVLTVVPNTVILALYRVLVEEKEKRRTRGAFQQYISPEVIRRLLHSPELVKPRKIEVTSLFSDVRGFTSIAEKMDAQDVAHLLNDYLTEMTRIIFTNQGTLDKYIGDAVMAFWGAPFEEIYHGPRACRAALKMLDRLEELRGDWQKQGKPLLDIGIGINTGFASVGNMGSALRYGYTVIGDSVNLASRLEGLNKLYGTRILVGESTRAQDAGLEFVFRELDWIRVKGKQQPASIYELMGFRTESNEWRERVDLFEAGLALYRRRDWSQAQAVFLLVLERWPGDGPAALFAQRCEKFLAESPASDWDGVYVATEK